jgi:hypothetical protein
MPILGTTTDYTGRTVDISVLQYPDALAVGTKKETPAFGNPSNLCAGVQKLVQRYTIMMLTNIDSQPEYPNFAASFLWTLQAGVSPVDSIRVRQIFALADYAVVNIIKSYQVLHPNLPLDEQLARTSLINLSLSTGTVEFDVQLTTLAGTAVNFLVPLPK